MSSFCGTKSRHYSIRKSAQIWLDAEHIEKLDWLVGHSYTNRSEMLKTLIDDEIARTAAYHYDRRARILDMRALHAPMAITRLSHN